MMPSEFWSCLRCFDILLSSELLIVVVVRIGRHFTW